MSTNGIISMSAKEIKRFSVIEQTIEKRMTQSHAASLLALSLRQIKRLVKQVRLCGARGVIHKLRGRPSNRRHSESIKKRAMKVYQDLYQGFGPTLFSEKLSEREEIRVNRETLRRWLLIADLWERHRKRSRHRKWRERKACFGEMVQLDGSHHDWLEGRGPWLVLMAFIDDATSEVFARFYDYEGTLPVMESFYQYIKRYGLPMSLYMDRHSAYQKAREEDEHMNGSGSQFARALKELGVCQIHAYSPEAKGRVERLFRTFQDRLVKELRLARIKTKEGANQLLKQYLPTHNRRFKRIPLSDQNLHYPVPEGIELKQVLSIQTKRLLRKDGTIQYKGKRYCLSGDWGGRRPGHLVAEERIDGKLYLTDEGRELRYHEITEPQLMRKPLFKAWVHQHKRQEEKLVATLSTG